MLNIELIRKQPDLVRHGLEKRGAPNSVEELIQLDEDRRSLILEGDGLRAKRNEMSNKVGSLIKGGNIDGAEIIRAEVRQIGERLQQIERQQSEFEIRFRLRFHLQPTLGYFDVAFAQGA